MKRAVRGKPKKATQKKAPVAVKKKAIKKKAIKKKAVKKKAARKILPKAKVRKKAEAVPRGKRKALQPEVRKLIPSAAVKAFDQAVNLFYRHNFEHARRAFASFIERFPGETEMIARARSYMAICDQRLSHPPSVPRDAEALYDRGVIELNLGRILEALSFFEKALKYEPQAPHILYSLAAAHARLGQVEKALEELKEAVRRREALRIQARHDSDFINLYTHPEFQDLVGWEIVEEPTPLPES